MGWASKSWQLNSRETGWNFWWITGWNMGCILKILKWAPCYISYILFKFGDDVRTTGCQGLYPLHVHGAVQEYEFHQKNEGKTTEMVASSKWLNTINQSNDSNGVCSLQYTVYIYIYTVYTITGYPGFCHPHPRCRSVAAGQPWTPLRQAMRPWTRQMGYFQELALSGGNNFMAHKYFPALSTYPTYSMDMFNTLTLSFQWGWIPGGDVEHRPKVRVLCLRDNVFEPRPGRGLECSACRPDLVRNIDKKGGIEFASSFPRHWFWLSIGHNWHFDSCKRFFEGFSCSTVRWGGDWNRVSPEQMGRNGVDTFQILIAMRKIVTNQWI